MIDGWDALIGNRHLVDWFAQGIRSGRLGGSFLFVGPPGVGKRSVANLLAKTLLCSRSEPTDMSPCLGCEPCVQVTAETHPDVIRVRKPADKSNIPLELLIGRPEVRMQEGFCRDVRLRPYYADRKVAILEDADALSEEGANCLLKTIEEPPANALVILIGTSEQKQLPTIRSRCRVIRFAPLNATDAARLLSEDGDLEATAEQISDAIEISAGDMSVARRLLVDEARGFRDSLVSLLANDAPNPMKLRKLLSSRVDEAGKEPAAKRAALRDIFSISIQHYRKHLRELAFADQDSESTLIRLDRSVRAIREVDRMANVATLIDCYSVDIASAMTGDRGEIGS